MLSRHEVESILDVVEGVGPTLRGGNSTITRVTWREQDLAVKDYSARTDAHDRLRREVNGLLFLESSGLQRFPRCVGIASDRRKAVFTWVDGETPKADGQSTLAMISVLQDLDRLARARLAPEVESAADSMNSISDIADQVVLRCAPLAASGCREVADFAESLSSTLARIPLVNEPGNSRSTLSLSDFGCHNMLLRYQSREYVFLDLEFFGWDDAHKLVIDTLLHPLAAWPSHLAADFLNWSCEIYSLDKSRLLVLSRLLSVKWATIVAARAQREALEGDAAASHRSLVRAQEYRDLAIGSEQVSWMAELNEGVRGDN